MRATHGLGAAPPPASMLMSVAGGFACARVALRDEWRTGAILAAVAVLFNLLIDDTGVNDLALLYTLCDVAGLLLGVKYGAERNRRLEQPAPSPADAPTPCASYHRRHRREHLVPVRRRRPPRGGH